MEIKLSKEDVKTVRRIARQEIRRVSCDLQNYLTKTEEQDFKEEYENDKRK